jgi:hypothetical protein
MKTKRDIQYYSVPMGYVCTIPKGTQVKPAKNLPDNMLGFWAEKWPEMSELAESYYRNYGFLVYSDDVEK